MTVINKGEKKYLKAIDLLMNLYNNHKKLGKKKTLNVFAQYIALVRGSAYKGNVKAQYELGLNYEDQNYFIPNPKYNMSKRLYWYTKASEAGHAETCNNLASLYEKGSGTKKNINKALSLYKRAYELGCTYAKGNYKLVLSEMKRK